MAEILGESRAGRRPAVILSGGGAKGAYEIGVLKALRAHGVVPEIYCGTSVGAFNAAMMASGLSLERAEEIWSTLQRSGVFSWRFDPRQLMTTNPRVPLNLALHTFRTMWSFFNGTLANWGAFWRVLDLDALLFDTAPLAALIERNVNIEAIRKSQKELFIALTCLSGRGKSAVASVDKRHVTHRHIHASCALPLIFPSVRIDEHVFCDGGVVMNTPLKLALDAGATDIYVVYLTPPPLKFVDATLPLAYQVTATVLDATVRADLDVARTRTAEFVAAFQEDLLVDGRLHVARAVEGKSEPEVKEFEYVRIFEINPSDDMKGMEGFLDFNPSFARILINEGQKETERILSSYYDEVITSRGGAKMNILRQRTH